MRGVGDANFQLESIVDARGRELPPGTNRRTNQAYDRRIGFQPGYEQLARIVAGLGKEVKRINQCLTLDGARAYAGQRRNWTAHEADITGPTGMPDGIKEVFVCDSKGNLKVVNGFGLTKSQYPVRKAYRTAYDTPEQRRANKYSKFLKDLTELRPEFGEDDLPHYQRDAAQIAPEFANIQRAITPKDMYKQFLFKGVYEALKPELQAAHVTPMLMARIFNKGLSDAYARHIKNPCLQQVLQVDTLEGQDQKVINKALRSNGYKTLVKNTIFRIFNNEEEFSQTQGQIDEMLSEIIDAVRGERLDSVHQLEQSRGRFPPSPSRRGRSVAQAPQAPQAPNENPDMRLSELE